MAGPHVMLPKGEGQWGQEGSATGQGTCGFMDSSGVVGIAGGCGRNLMLAAFKVAHMSCTQRQSGGAAERGEAHVGGRGAVGWSGVVGIACGSE